MLKSIVVLFLITLIPGLELRASIPAGIFGKEWLATPLPWPTVVVVCVLSNILIGMAVFFLLDPMVKLFRRIGWVERILTATLDRAQGKLRPSVERYGFWGLALFIGIPLPLTGAYTGAMGAYMLGMSKTRFMLANLAGVCLAGVAVTVICLLMQAGVSLPVFQWLIKQ